MKYCRNCGKPMENDERFCSGCGANQNAGFNPYGPPVPPYRPTFPMQYESEEHLPFSCMVAYLPGLFFVPLITDFRDYTHRKCASQGLWITIIAIAAAILMPFLLRFGIQMDLFNWSHLISLFVGWNAENWFYKLWQLILFHWLVLPLGLYVPINSLHGFFRGTYCARPYQIPLFGRFNLIPPTTKLEKENIHE